MKWAVIVARVLVGFAFFASSVTFFLNAMPEQEPPPEGSALAHFMGAMIPTGYMKAIKVFELVGGALLLVGRFPLVGLTLVTPVAVNILFFEMFLLHSFGPGHVLVPLCGFLVFAYWSHFRPVFAIKPQIG
jgi:uncharacterized membrane protein YphA (DoxX/SURF4 family)